MIGDGINTVRINGEVKHITDLEPATLCLEWTKLKNENNELYEYNKRINSGWRGVILRLLGIHLPDKKTLSSKVLMLKVSLSIQTEAAPAAFCYNWLAEITQDALKGHGGATRRRPRSEGTQKALRL